MISPRIDNSLEDDEDSLQEPSAPGWQRMYAMWAHHKRQSRTRENTLLVSHWWNKLCLLLTFLAVSITVMWMYHTLWQSEEFELQWMKHSIVFGLMERDSRMDWWKEDDA